MSGTESILLTENINRYKQAAQAAERAGFTRLAGWLESSGPLLKLACVSPKASDLVHTYRTVREIAVTSGAELALEVYKHTREELSTFLKSSEVENELRDLIELEIRRTDALISEAGQLSRRTVIPSGLRQAALTEKDTEILEAWSKRMKEAEISPELKAAFEKLVSRIKPGDSSWAAISEIALDRARRVNNRFPNLTRAAYEENSAARKLIDEAYTYHGKGEMLEHYARNCEIVKDRVDGELRAANYLAARRGPEAKAIQTAGELRLGKLRKDGTVGSWKKFADNSVLIVTEETQAAAGAGSAVARKIDGTAQPTALFEFKAEAGVSAIPEQQERALPRMIDQWAKGEPVYVSAVVTDESGQAVTKYYVLQPPDSKAGLSYYGIGTSNSFIAERESLAKQGANVRNLNLDISNKELRDLWNELFWKAYESLKK